VTPPFRHSSVRDLAWVMASPSLLSAMPAVVSNDICQAIYHGNVDWLLELDHQPDLLISKLKEHNTRRLGYYFETLVAFWLQQRIAGEYFASQVRVYDQKRVLGEFDFLFTTRSGDTLQHWETAVKFYLYCPTDREMPHWYGPNAKDRLDIKLDRVFNHQLTLGSTPQGKRLLEHLGFQSVKAQTFFKGYLFYPMNSQRQQALPQELPDYIAPNHLQGWWTRFNHLELPASAADQRWMVLPRLEWLALKVITPEHDARLLDQQELKDYLARHFAHGQQSLLVAQMARMESGDWQELSRGFVVSEQWPSGAGEPSPVYPR